MSSSSTPSRLSTFDDVSRPFPPNQRLNRERVHPSLRYDVVRIALAEPSTLQQVHDLGLGR